MPLEAKEEIQQTRTEHEREVTKSDDRFAEARTSASAKEESLDKKLTPASERKKIWRKKTAAIAPRLEEVALYQKGASWK